jgi:hypothetical protein
MVNGEPEVRAVKLGASDDTSTEIVSGLKEGDVVVVTSTSSSSNSSSSNNPQGGFVIGGLGGGEMFPIGR